MKTRLTFSEMQTLIDGVVNGVITNGFGYKQFYIDYYTAVLYGEKAFGGTEENPRDISEVYEELNTYMDVTGTIDAKQYDTILAAIDEGIQHRLNLMYIPASDSDMALAILIDKLSLFVDKLSTIDLDVSQMAEFVKAFTDSKSSFTPEKIVEAMKNTDTSHSKKETKSKAKKNSVVNTAETKAKIEKIK